MLQNSAVFVTDLSALHKDPVRQRNSGRLIEFLASDALPHFRALLTLLLCDTVILVQQNGLQSCGDTKWAHNFDEFQILNKTKQLRRQKFLGTLTADYAWNTENREQARPPTTHHTRIRLAGQTNLK